MPLEICYKDTHSKLFKTMTGKEIQVVDRELSLINTKAKVQAVFPLANLVYVRETKKPRVRNTEKVNPQKNENPA